MFERYTKKARRVIYFASLEASGYGSHHIETEHILLGLMRESPSLLKRVLGLRGQRGAGPRGNREIHREGATDSQPLSKCLSQMNPRKVLMRAMEEADALGHRPIGSAHLLLSLLSFRKSRVTRILAASGVKQQRLHDRLASEMTNIEGTIVESGEDFLRGWRKRRGGRAGTSR